MHEGSVAKSQMRPTKRCKSTVEARQACLLLRQARGMNKSPLIAREDLSGRESIQDMFVEIKVRLTLL